MRVLLVAIILSLSLAGCAGTPAEEFETPEQDDQGRYIITMTQALTFVPENAKVPVGSTVVWVNEGGVHNTQSDEGLWASQVTGEKGEHFAYTFDTAGDFGYYCNPHLSLGMTGVIRVE